MIETCGVDRVLFKTDFGPVPMSPKLYIDLVDNTIWSDEGDRKEDFLDQHTCSLFSWAETAPRLVPRACLALCGALEATWSFLR